MNWIAANLFIALIVVASSVSLSAQTPATPPIPAPVQQTPAQSSQGSSNTTSSEKPVTAPSQVDPGQLNILPSAGVSKESAAPTMVFECAKNPAECTKPSTPADKVDIPDASATPPAASPVKP